MDYYQNFGFGKLMPMSRTYLEKMYEEERKMDMANENFFTHRIVFKSEFCFMKNDSKTVLGNFMLKTWRE